MTRKSLQLFILAATLALFSACNNETTSGGTKDTTLTTSTPINNDISKMDQGMMMPVTAMMSKMTEMKMTGDFDNDYAALMIEHHQTAVEISEMYLQKSTDAEMKKMAQTMVPDHKSEIEALKKYSANHNQSSAEHKKMEADHTHAGGKHHELAESLQMMTDKMKGVTMTGNPDKDYALLMQSHHEDAVTLSKAEISHGHHAALKQMAQKMIEDDTKEIKEFQNWLSKIK